MDGVESMDDVECADGMECVDGAERETDRPTKRCLRYLTYESVDVTARPLLWSRSLSIIGLWIIGPAG